MTRSIKSISRFSLFLRGVFVVFFWFVCFVVCGWFGCFVGIWCFCFVVFLVRKPRQERNNRKKHANAKTRPIIALLLSLVVRSPRDDGNAHQPSLCGTRSSTPNTRPSYRTVKDANDLPTQQNDPYPSIPNQGTHHQHTNTTIVIIIAIVITIIVIIIYTTRSPNVRPGA